MAKKKQDVKVYLPELVKANLLVEYKTNTQKQSKHTFRELRESIRDNGFDTSLLVTPTDDGYEIIAGNHRYKAGKAEGMTEFPCIIRKDWNDVKVAIESVRRNYVRGDIDKKAFTKEVDRLAKDRSLPLDVIYTQMGFEDADAFADYYERERERQKQMAQKVATGSTTAAAVRIMDDLAGVVSQMLSDHGHTIPNSFIIFPTAGKNHLFVASNPTLKNTLQAVVETAISQNLDINVALTGLLQIGMAHSNFIGGDSEAVEEAGEITEGDSDLEQA